MASEPGLKPESTTMEKQHGTTHTSDDADTELREAMEAVCAMSERSQRLQSISVHTRRPGGLKSDRLRQLVWPILLDCSQAGVTTPETENQAQESIHWRELPEHRDEGQVLLDVNRSFIYYPNDKSETQLDRLKADLLEIITATLRRHPKLCYFQGFHDIAQVLLLVLGKHLAFEAVTHLSLLRLRDFMLPSLASSITHLELLPAILAAADPLLAQHVSHTKPFFALAATLTLFAHDVESYAEIARLFDFLLAEEAAVAIYMFASIILSRRDELLEISAEDQDILSFTLSKLPKPLDFEAIIQRCITLIESHPPDTLPRGAWGKVSPYSVLKTTRGRKLHSLVDAEELLDAQLTQFAWQERRQKVLTALWTYRKPVGGIGAAVLVALLSYWLQQPSGASALSYTTNKALLFGKMLLRLVQG